MIEPFVGAKLAILVGERLVAILRDDIPTIPYPNHWDLPGGGREGHETPVETALRETNEEMGLSFEPNELNWSKCFPTGDSIEWLFVTEQPQFDPDQVQFGNEGQCWQLMPIDNFLNQARAIPHQQERLREFIDCRRKPDS